MCYYFGDFKFHVEFMNNFFVFVWIDFEFTSIKHVFKPKYGPFEN